MNIKTTLKAGRVVHNHNETQARGAAPAKCLRVRTGVKAGRIIPNHNATQVRLEDG